MTDYKVTFKSNGSVYESIITKKKHFDDAIKEIKRRHGNVDILSATPIEVKFPGKK